MSARLPIGATTSGSKKTAFDTSAANFRRRALALRPLRFVLLASGFAALLFGLWTGLARLGIGLSGAAPQLVEFHGALMICGFFGTLICIERAVALNRPLAYLIPAFAAVGVIALLARAVTLAGEAFLISSLALTAASLWNMRRQQVALLTVTPSVAALSWGIGTLIWLMGRPLPESTGWWLAFLVVTVAAERLELSRIVAPPTIARVAFAGAIAVLLIGVARDELERPLSPFMGSGLILCGVWLLIYDLARRTMKLSGQIRFTALCMLLGYCWLIAGGFELLARPLHLSAFWYDAVVHAITLGFVLSMVFGHTLIIFPSVVGFNLRYSPALYVPLFLLHISIAIRTFSDFSGWPENRSASAFITIIALIWFGATVAIVSIWHRPLAQRSAKGI